MRRPDQDLPDEDLFAAWRSSRDPRLLGEVFDRCGDELLRVATYLCAGDRTAIEDALQATFLTAIDDAATFDATRPLRPWLLGILTNHVRKERRRRQRTTGADAERASSADPTLEYAAGRELRAALAHSLEQVASPYREVLVLHLEHDLDSTAIGRALARQPSTVRTQIARGLTLLRDLLPAGLTAGALLSLSPSAMAAVRSRVLAQASPTPLTPTLEPAATGTRSLLTMLTLGLLATAAAVAFTFSSPDEPLPSAAPLATAPTAPTAPTALAEPAPPRREAADSIVPPSQPALAARDFQIAVIDKASSAPIVGAMVVCGSRETELAQRSESLHYATSDARGMASFRSHPGVAAYHASVVGTAALLEFLLDDVAVGTPTIALDSGARVSLTVRDPSGAAVAGARVLTNAGSHTLRDWQPLGVTDAAGRLVATHLQGHCQFVAQHDDHAPSPMLTLRTVAGGDYQSTLTLSGLGARVRGRVVRDDGQACPHALIVVLGLAGWPHVPVYLHADAEGRFDTAGLHPGHVAVVAKTQAGRNGQAAWTRCEVGAGALAELELRIAPGARVFGEIATPSGLPATISARFVPEAIYELPYLSAWEFTRAESFELAGLVPGQWELRASAGSLEVREVVTLAAGQELHWTPQLPVALPLRLRLRNERGEPLAGWRVARVEATGFSSSSMLVTDAEGELNPAAAGSDVMWHVPANQLARVRLFAPGSPFPAMETPPLAPSEASQVVTVPDRLRPTRALRGSVRAKDGSLPPYQVIVRQPSTGFAELRGEHDGANFTAGPLGPGTYDVEILASGLPSLHLPSVRVPADADAELGTFTLGVLGRVLVTVPAEVDGADLVLTQLGGSDARYGLARQSDGSFRSGRVPHGRYRITGLARNRIVSACEVEVQGQLAEIALPTTPGPSLALTVHLPQDDLRNQAGFSATLNVRDTAGRVALTTELGRMFAGRYQPSADFRFALPPGDYRLRVVGAGGARGEASVEVTAQGGRVAVQLAR